jgi:hypothetical protein
VLRVKTWSTRVVPLLLAGCVGPPAPDVEICRDVIARVCASPVCDTAASTLSVSDDGTCEATLRTRTGCSSDTFTFTRLSRNRWLECRLALVHDSTDVTAKSSCPEVTEFLSNCPDVADLLKGL